MASIRERKRSVPATTGKDERPRLTGIPSHPEPFCNLNGQGNADIGAALGIPQHETPFRWQHIGP
jgi:hypothetical protein